MEMASQWVRWVRWRGEDTEHAGSAVGLGLSAYLWHRRSRPYRSMRKSRSPLSCGKKKVGIEVKTVIKGGTPKSYTVIWEEHTTEKNAPTVKMQGWSATLTMGRIVLKRMEDILDNRLGICVTGYDWGEQSS